jgi:hypothetical protein|tara:strand:+ start:358 stop:594 length:237 start_codon:yes stop_codon:yes gene_type:complete
VEKHIDQESEERTTRTMKKVMVGGGLIFVLIGLFLQWPVTEKSYMEFIDGSGYIPMILGLIMVILGFSIKLLMGTDED